VRTIVADAGAERLRDPKAAKRRLVATRLEATIAAA
jgi:hypothetical protein